MDTETFVEPKTRNFQSEIMGTGSPSDSKIEALLAMAEKMLLESYARCESSEAWWSRFSNFYLNVSADLRREFGIKVGWLFCQYGETEWVSLKSRLDEQLVTRIRTDKSDESARESSTLE